MLAVNKYLFKISCVTAELHVVVVRFLAGVRYFCENLKLLIKRKIWEKKIQWKLILFRIYLKKQVFIKIF